MFFVLFWPHNIGTVHKTLVCDSSLYALEYSVPGDEVWCFSSSRDYYEWVETQNPYLIAARFLVDCNGTSMYLRMSNRKDFMK